MMQFCILLPSQFQNDAHCYACVKRSNDEIIPFFKTVLIEHNTICRGCCGIFLEVMLSTSPQKSDSEALTYKITLCFFYQAQTKMSK